MINREIDYAVAKTDTILFIWTTLNEHFHNNIADSQINHSIIINNKSVYQLLQQYNNQDKWICFGGMSIFTKKFVKLIQKHTNLFSKLHLFHTRDHRCFFERILFLIAKELVPNFSKQSLQGDIFDHPYPFRNTDPNMPTESFFTKVWIGR
jgi:hypothetical protein